MKFLGRVWSDVSKGENIDTYLTVLFAVGIAVLNLLGLASQQLVVSLTLAVLALITVSNLINRHQLEIISTKISENHKHDVLEKMPPEFSTHIETAKDVWMTGIHHSSIMNEHYHSFEKMIMNGGTLRVLTVDPSGAACSMAAMRFSGNIDPEQERIRTIANLHLFQELAKKAPKRVQIRTIDYLMEYNAFLINSHPVDSIIYIQRYTFRILGGARKPKIVYTPSDVKWYEITRSEVLALWECGKPYEPK